VHAHDDLPDADRMCGQRGAVPGILDHLDQPLSGAGPRRGARERRWAVLREVVARSSWSSLSLPSRLACGTPSLGRLTARCPSPWSTGSLAASVGGLGHVSGGHLNPAVTKALSPHPQILLAACPRLCRRPARRRYPRRLDHLGQLRRHGTHRHTPRCHQPPACPGLWCGWCKGCAVGATRRCRARPPTGRRALSPCYRALLSSASIESGVNLKR
jgi:hypothetical protein